MDKHEVLEAQLRRFEATMESLIRDGSSIDERRTAWIAGCELLDRNAAASHRDWLDCALFRLHSRIWNSRESGAVSRPQDHGHANDRERGAAFLQG
jgi:hypothetical protein